MASFCPQKRKRSNIFSYRDKASRDVSASVVSLVSKTGGNTFFKGSGTIIDSTDVNGIYVSTILTSASILRSSGEKAGIRSDIKVDVYISDGQLFEGKVCMYDLHYNIATIKIERDAPLPTAIVRHLDDSISVNPNICCSTDDDVGSASFQTRRHSEKFNISPGDLVVGFGRYSKEPHNLMSVSGKFSIDCRKFDCKELYRVNCKIPKYGNGGPLVNHNGEVIGVMFYKKQCTPFLPINIASKCMEHFEKYRTFCRPWLGMEATNLYATKLGNLEIIVRKFPNIFKGVIVEQVTEGSPADCAGILPDDVIIECNGNPVEGFLEFVEMLFDKAGSKERTIELVVLRGETGAKLNLSVALDEATPDRFYRWPLPKPKRKRPSTPGSVVWFDANKIHVDSRSKELLVSKVAQRRREEESQRIIILKNLYNR